MKRRQGIGQPNRSGMVQLALINNFDVIDFAKTALSVCIEIGQSLETNNSSGLHDQPLHVKLTNGGEESLCPFTVEAITPVGVVLVEPGLLFGNSRKFANVPRLGSKSSITFKLAIRASYDFIFGDLTLIFSSISKEPDTRIIYQRIIGTKS